MYITFSSYFTVTMKKFLKFDPGNLFKDGVLRQYIAECPFGAGNWKNHKEKEKEKDKVFQELFTDRTSKQLIDESFLERSIFKIFLM